VCSLCLRSKLARQRRSVDGMLAERDMNRCGVCRDICSRLRGCVMWEEESAFEGAERRLHRLY